MKFEYLTLKNCASADGVVVVIDVLRAFTTAAFAFGAGAVQITLVKTVEEAQAWRARDPQVLLMGEVGGLPIDGFDFGNSPTEIETQDLRGRHLIQRTSSGTQGAVCSRNANTLLGGSFCVAGATARYLTHLAPLKVTFILTGITPDGRGEEDQACAEYLAALLSGQNPDPSPYLDRVRDSMNGRIFADPRQPEFPATDLQHSIHLDAFSFALPIHRQNDDLVMVAEQI